jgi:hypothetical protein
MPNEPLHLVVIRRVGTWAVRFACTDASERGTTDTEYGLKPAAGAILRGAVLVPCTTGLHCHNPEHNSIASGPSVDRRRESAVPC